MPSLQAEWDTATPKALESEWAQAKPVDIAEATQKIQRDPIKRAVLNQPPDPSLASRVGSFVKQAALPTMGQLGGFAAGAPLVPFTGPIGPLATEALGSGLGEYANQKLGITPKSVMTPDATNWFDVGLSAAAPAIGRGVTAGIEGSIGGLARRFPGAGVGLQEWGAGKIQDALKLLKKQVGDVDKLYDEVAKHNPVIDMPNTLQAAEKAWQTFASNTPKAFEDKAPVKEAIATASKLVEELKGAGSRPSLSFQKVRTMQKLMNEHFDTGNATLKNFYGELQQAIQKDLEAAAASPVNQPASDALKAANLAHRQNIAYKKLKDAMEKQAIGPSETNPEWTQLKRKPLYKALATDTDVTRNLTPSQLKGVESTVKGLGTIPGLPSVGGHVPRIVLGSGIGGFIGYKVAPEKDKKEGAIIGSVLGTMAVESMGALATTDAGKDMIIRAANLEPSPHLRALAATVAAALSAQTH